MLEAKSVTSAGAADLLSDRGHGDADDRRAKHWLATRLDRMDREGGFAELCVLMTPALALALLALNTKNRRIRPNPLGTVKRAMAGGRWVNTGHPVVISWDRLVQDGQHRLTAVVETGVSVEMDVRFGVDPLAFANTDTGTRRSASDVLNIAGYSQEVTIAAAARILLTIGRGNATIHYGYHTDPTNDVILTFAQANPNLRDAARIGHSSARALKINASAAAAAAFLIAQKAGLPSAEEFFVAARTGLNISAARDPLKSLERVIESGELRSQLQVCAALVLAFNRRRAGKSATHKDLTWQAGTPFPEAAE